MALSYKRLLQFIEILPYRVHSQFRIDVQQDLESSLHLHQRSAQQKGNLIKVTITMDLMDWPQFSFKLSTNE
jgi:hypothetical protein